MQGRDLNIYFEKKGGAYRVLNPRLMVVFEVDKELFDKYVRLIRLNIGGMAISCSDLDERHERLLENAGLLSI